MRLVHTWVVVLMLALASVVLPARAQDLVIALRSEPTSLDPQYHALTSNIQIAKTVFDPLVRTDGDGTPIPALAHSWSVKGNVWEFFLREDVRFSDGTSFTAADVLFTYRRVFRIANSPSSFSLYLGDIARIDAPDAWTVRITTRGPAPTLLTNLSMVPVLAQRAVAALESGPTTIIPQHNGNGLTGTGPYRLVSWVRGQEIVLERNPHYWGDRSAWDRVVYRPIPEPGARVAALRDGSVDFIEDPPTDQLDALRHSDDIVVREIPSVRVIYIALNQSDHVPAGISGTDGRNPMQDRRVRMAMSLAIDREAIVRDIMKGSARPAGNLLPWPGFGTTRALARVAPADLERARVLLAEAGYPDGFELLLGAPDGRYTNDRLIANAIAEMWGHIGIRAKVETMPPSLFFRMRDEYAFSAYLAGWAANTNEMLNPLTALVASRDPARGMGTTNWSHYSNRELDGLVLQASRTIDDARRRNILQQASHVLMDDYGILPLQFEMSVWAMRKGLHYDGRADQLTLAQYIGSVP